MAVVLYSVSSALCFGIGGVLQKYGVSSRFKKEENVSSIKKNIRKGLSLFTHPVWFIGGVLSVLGWFLYFNALTLGDYLFVKPLINCGLVFGILGAVIFLKEKISRGEILSIISIAVGAISLSFIEPGSKTLTIDPNTLGLVLSVLMILILLFQFGSFIRSRILFSEMSMAITTGIIYGMGEIFTNILAIQSNISTNGTQVLTGQLIFFATSITFLMIFFMEISGFILKQLAFIKGRASVIIPITSSLSIIIPIIAAILVFGEPLIVVDQVIPFFSFLRPIGIITILAGVICLQISKSKKMGNIKKGK
ncbi:MAG: hypothetical protein ACTSUV_04780 [Candidatus Ranarchaeia archaeon]